MSAQLVPLVTLAQLTKGPSIDSRTITVWLQIVFSTQVPGSSPYYTVGGVPSGVLAFVEALTVPTSNFLQAIIQGEETVTASSVTGGSYYRYIPSTDKIQIFHPDGTEYGASEALSAEVLADTIVGRFQYERL